MSKQPSRQHTEQRPIVRSLRNLPTKLASKLKALGVKPTLWMILVSISQQRMILLKNGEEAGDYAISTSAGGAGQQEGSNQTPLGLHRVAEKIGEGAALGAVFKSRVPTGEVWAPGSSSGDDLILTRILWLEGLEEGFNRGRDAQGKLVDSRERYIYIHGTNHEASIGTPGSHGCVRMGNADVLQLFEKVPAGTLVWISP